LLDDLKSKLECPPFIVLGAIIEVGFLRIKVGGFLLMRGGMFPP
jgi:hypothetical protein